MVGLYSRMVSYRRAIAGPVLILLALPALSALSAQPAPPPPPFIARCATCHGDEARGTAQGPGLVMNPRVAAQSVEQLRDYLQRGNPGAGMPAFADLPADDLLALARYLRRINVETIIPPPADVPARKGAWGPPQPGDWRTYNGSDSANRYSPLTQITRANVGVSEAEMGVPDAAFRARSHTARRRRRALRDGSEPGGGARRGDGTCVVDLLASADTGTGGRLAAWHQSRRRAPRRHRVLRDRQRPPARARSWHRRPSVGNRPWRPTRRRPSRLTTTAAPSRRSSSATWSWPASRARMRASAVSSRPSTPRAARSCGAAGPCRVEANPASRPGRDRSRSEAAGPPG